MLFQLNGFDYWCSLLFIFLQSRDYQLACPISTAINTQFGGIFNTDIIRAFTSFLLLALILIDFGVIYEAKLTVCEIDSPMNRFDCFYFRGVLINLHWHTSWLVSMLHWF